MCYKTKRHTEVIARPYLQYILSLDIINGQSSIYQIVVKNIMDIIETFLYGKGHMR